MSRSMLALLLPFPPTALQVLMAGIASGIVETNRFDLLAVWCKSLLWALHVADGSWVSWLQFIFLENLFMIVI